MDNAYRTFAARIQALGVTSDRYCLGRSMEKIAPKIALDLTGRKGEDVQKAQYAIKYYPEEEVFFVWNLENHRLHDATLYLNVNNCDIRRLGSGAFQAVYKTYRTHNDNVWEKVCVVGIEYFQLFFSHIEYWMRFNKYDLEYANNIKCAIQEESEGWRSERERREWSTAKRSREQERRFTILEAYEHRCAVCGCDVPELLQIAEVPVKRKGRPDGICLCANHKVLYEQRLIDIDLETGAVRCIDSRIRSLMSEFEAEATD